MFSVCWKWMFDCHTAATSCSALTSCWMRISNPGFWKSTYHRGETHTHRHSNVYKCSRFHFLCFCSLHSNTALDVSIKGQMVKDLLNLAGFRLPRKEDVIASCSSASSCANRYRGRWCMSLFNCDNLGETKNTICNYLDLNLVKMCWNNICV